MGAGDLDQFNGRWGARLAVFCRCAPPPWWAPDLIVTPELRGVYETFLPVTEFLADLARLARTRLPGPEWLPRLLRETAASAGGCCGGRTPEFPSLPDLWRTLPAELAGRVTFAEADLEALWRALANPARFGTGFGRYPEQLRQIRDWAARLPRPSASPEAEPLRLLDLGCGTGEGTAEAAGALAAAAGRPVAAVGVTLEPLEVAMAEERLPHLLAAADPEGRCGFCFVAGDACAVPETVGGPFDLILANGLVGGRFLDGDAGVRRFLGECARLLASGGRVGLAQRFHGGHQAAVARVAKLARERGWRVAGPLAALWLKREE